MPAPHPLPAAGSVFLDARGGERALRVSWHQERDLVVLSLWRENLCTGSFRLSVEEVPDLIDTLRAGLHQAYAASHPAAAGTVRPPGDPADVVGAETLPLRRHA